ncbi:hypothetical protein DFJ74DRAFT_612718, partial [Hyaloraphidium curvatum]
MRISRISLAALAAAGALCGALLAAPAAAAPANCYPTVPRRAKRQLGGVSVGAFEPEPAYAGRQVGAATTVSAGTPVVTACATLAVSTNGRCGRYAGGAKCPDNLCCSRWGYCQDDGGDSGTLNREFRPGPPPRPASADPCLTPSSPPPKHRRGLVTNDGRCGIQAGGKKCPEGLCCSEWGWCQDDGDDSGIPWCGGGCQLGYGKCFVGCKPPTHTVTRVSRGTPVYNACTNIPISDSGVCGSVNGKRCAPGLCCSRWGFCQEWCGTGCQLGYGKCFVGSDPVRS